MDVFISLTAALVFSLLGLLLAAVSLIGYRDTARRLKQLEMHREDRP